MYIPFSYLTRKQVAELLNRHPATVDKYTKTGIEKNGQVHLLKKEKGKYKTEDVITFKNNITR